MEIQRIGVIGAGTMGSGIAQVCAAAGLDVVMVDISAEAVERGLGAIRGSLERQVRKGALGAAQGEAAVARVLAATDYAAFSGCDVLIEAATENLELKKRILRQADAAVGAGTVIATNTSSLSISELAAVVSHPERFIGMHFFNPVPVMRLVEVIAGMQTSPATRELAERLVAAIGKQAVVVANRPGFVVNRILCPMINEAVFVLQEKLATAEDIDAGMVLGSNQPIGPLALADLIGLDTMLSVMESFYRELGDPKYRPAPLLREMVQAGYLGRKSGRGFHSYG
ncbi:3-hydroxybutyryl-CoA dehydrogenase [Pseudoduganella namucuonensis]|uniref:3-hydroxybutyryl-CoA dehydrogenase n=1 Tax=Pseudoduganella namucuonensis TaxID=1035707 RepID=A0A1I7KZ89_9BURK|nr:3-hydroxybutyryl-CoA dehydrogenase [Pseudoduganella namucuonensis]SFV02698.1 3-hydroxybutyryl-CoA dehydrogenase [Pseudoduganella namucuonensis]